MPEVCCSIERGVTGPTCARTGLPTRPVPLATVLHHTRPELVEPRTDPAYGFCDVPSCDVVYVGTAGQYFHTADLQTRVGLKVADDPIPVCYCWSFTERQIVEDVRAHGRSTIRDDIRQQVLAGRCACETNNPSGRCCLGDVARAIRKAKL